MQSDHESFPPGVAAKLKTYVYRLIDPRDGETFYVGKGRGDRVFAHIRAQVEDGDEVDNKLKRIREIHLAGFDVAHVIHRHGMDDATALEVEAALIDAYPGLTNIAGGAGSGDYGAMHAKEIIKRYSATPADFQHKAILISVNRSATERQRWRIFQLWERRRGGSVSLVAKRRTTSRKCTSARVFRMNSASPARRTRSNTRGQRSYGA
jgi:hypothetical protein